MVLSFNVHSARTDAISAWSTGSRVPPPTRTGLADARVSTGSRSNRGDNLDRRLFIEQGFLLQRLRRRDFTGRSGGERAAAKTVSAVASRRHSSAGPRFCHMDQKASLGG